MPTPHNGRPPGRRDGCRPPEGPAPLAATTKQSKHKTIIPVIDKARESVAVLQAAGHPDLANAVSETLIYAEQAATQLARGSNFAGTPENHPIGVTKRFRDHIYASIDAAVEASEDETKVPGAPKVVREKMRAFLEGKWTPQRPPRQSFGTGPDAKVMLNVRVPEALWDAVNEYGKDVEARSFPHTDVANAVKLTASQVALAALREHFGSPETEDSTTTA